MNSDNQLIQDLIQEGREKGYISKTKLQEALSEDESFEEIANEIEESGIEILDDDEIKDEEEPEEPEEIEEDTDFDEDLEEFKDDLENDEELIALNEEIERDLKTKDIDDIVSGISSNTPSDDPIKMYLKEIGQIPLLTPFQELDLSRKVREGLLAEEKLNLIKSGKSKVEYDEDEIEELNESVQTGKDAREIIINSNLRLVVSIAKRYVGRGMLFLDLIQEGNIGLMKAYEKFDTSHDVKFISYAVHWINQSILEAIEKRNGIHGDELPQDFESQDDNVDEDYIEAPNTPELTPTIFLDESENEYERDLNQKEAIKTLFNDLNDREIYIIKSYFGIGQEKAKTLEEIGDTLHLTKERVRQIKESGMKKLRSSAISNSKVLRIYKEYVIAHE